MKITFSKNKKLLGDSYHKNKNFMMIIVTVIHDGNIINPITIHVNKDKLITTTVSIWGKEYYSHGRGIPNEEDYNKIASSINNALNSAGITLSQQLKGDYDVNKALEMIVKELGYNGKTRIIYL